MHLINDLIFFEERDYNNIIKDFIAFFSSLKGEIRLFSFGYINNHGISDLDLCIVFDETKTREVDLRTMIEKAKNFRKKLGLHSYIFTHDILVYPLSIFRYIKYLHTIENLNLLFGTKLNLIEPDTSEKYFVRMSNFINFTGNSLKWLYGCLYKKGNISLREVLLCLNSAKHSLVYFHNEKQECSKKWHLESLIDELSSIRKKYEGYNPQEIFSLVEKTYVILLDAFKCFSKKKSDKYFNLPKSKDRYSFFLERQITDFTDNNSGIKNKLAKRILPLIYLYQGASYARLGDGAYAKIHKILFPIYNEIDIVQLIYKDVLRLQIQLADTFVLKYGKYGISPMIPLNCFYMRPKIGAKWRILGLFNRALWRMQKYNLQGLR